MFRTSLVVAFALALAACASDDAKELMIKKKAAEGRIELQLKDQPQWYMNPPVDENAIYGVGTSSLSNQGAALQQAKLAAMVEIAQQVSSVVDGLATSTFTGQEANIGTIEKGVFQNAAKAIVSAPLRGVVILNRQSVKTDSGIQTYVMVKILKEDAAKSAVQQIQSLDEEIMETNKNLLNDLDEAIRKRL